MADAEMAAWLAKMPPASGRMLKENGDVFNLADFFASAGLARMTVAGTAPSSPAQGDFWYDTSVGTVLKIYNGATWDTV